MTHESEEAVANDIKRDESLKNIGFTVLRFSSWEVLNRINDVSGIIEDWIKENAKVPPKGKRRR